MEVQRLSDVVRQTGGWQRLSLFVSLKQLRESVDLALESKNRDTATSRMEFARKCVKDIEGMAVFPASSHVLAEIRAVLAVTEERFKTSVHINASRGRVAKASSLKTDKAKRKHLELARDEIQVGLATGQGDATAFAAELSKIEERLEAVGTTQLEVHESLYNDEHPLRASDEEQMPAAKCAVCGREVNMDAATCLHCRAPLAEAPATYTTNVGRLDTPTPRWSMILAGVFGLAVFIAGVLAWVAPGAGTTNLSSASPLVTSLAAPLQHHYAATVGNLFGYRRDISQIDRQSGIAERPLLMVDYRGRTRSGYEFVSYESNGMATFMSCQDPCEYLTALGIGGNAVLPVARGSVLWAMIDDARNGFLDRAQAEAATQPQSQATSVPTEAATSAEIQPSPTSLSSPPPQASLVESQEPERAEATEPGASYSEAEIFQPTASINCGSAHADAQRLICSDLELGEQQLTLNRRFDADRLRLQSKLPADTYAAFLNESSAALRHRDDDCHDKACVSAWYATRAAQLGSWEAKTP